MRIIRGGFQVEVKRQGEVFGGCYYASKYGGEQKAKAAAKQQEELLISILPPVLPIKYSEEVRSNTGVRGVSRSVKFDKRRNAEYVYYHYYTDESHTLYVGKEPVDEGQDLKVFEKAKRIRRRWEKLVLTSLGYELKRGKLKRIA